MDFLPKQQRAVMLPNRSVALVALLVLLVNLGATTPAVPFDARIEQLINEGEIGNTVWGVDIRDVNTGRVLYSHNSNHILMPASTNKLLTSATALDALGSAYRYRTTLHYDGEVDGSVLEGNLIIRGAGDPTFGSSAMPPDDNPLRQWARRLAKLGVTRIEGRLIGDDDTFDNNPYAVGWDIDYLTSQAGSWMGISTNGLSYSDNVVKVRVTAGDVGERANIYTSPSGYLDLRNQITTRASSGRHVEWKRTLSTETYTLEGFVSRRFDGTFFKPVYNPTLMTMYIFKRYLREAGIEVDAPIRDVDDLEEKPDYEEVNPLFVHFSAPLKDILKLMNHESNNFYAEHIFRTFSPDGTTESAEKRVKNLLSRAGAAVDNISIRDGSGLSRKDFVTPAAMSQMLVYMRNHREADAFRNSMAMGGEPESTLQYRLGGLPVRAKTGSLAYVRALCGYAQTGGNRTVAFAILANNYTVPSYRITQTINRIAETLVTTSVG